MNTAALKAFAPAVRRALHEAVSRKLDVALAAKTPDYLTTFSTQVTELRRQAAADRDALIERVAYTWFNRFTALRYLDARGWHPFNLRVLTASDVGATQPDVLRVTREGALPEALARHTDATRIRSILAGEIPSDNPQAEVYRQLVLASCRFYNALLPNLFERLDDTTELLLPDDLLTEQSVVAGFRTEITDHDCADVEIIGWLYQYYISEKKDEVMARKSAVPTDDIPSVTQLFTPHWIVRYIVENSLGRLWLLNRPSSRLRDRMQCYIETAQEADFPRLQSPEDLRILDPAVGSGHMLTYAFDLLYAIYEEEGYAASEIPQLILRHNLRGIDIDTRAAQLAQLALVLKAREKSRRFFQADVLVRPRVIAFQNVRFAEGEIEQFIRELSLGSLFDSSARELFGQFAQATTFGSLIRPAITPASLVDLRRAIHASDVSGQLLLSATYDKVLIALEQAEYLAELQHIILTNPPYLGGNGMNTALKSFAKRHYPDAKADLYAMFIVRGLELVVYRGLVAMVTMQSWMFLSSFENLRRQLLSQSHLSSLVQIGYNSFPELNSKVVQASAFVLKRATADGPAAFVNLNDAPQASDKESVFYSRLHERAINQINQSDFNEIPGAPLAYWTPSALRKAFSDSRARPLGSLSPALRGLETGDNARFLRYWHEVCSSATGYNLARADALASQYVWFPYNKGGAARKWYGNNELVVNWRANGADVKELLRRNYPELGESVAWKICNESHYFQTGITWGGLTSNYVTFRLSDQGALFDSNKGAMMFPDPADLPKTLLFLNSSVARQFLQALNPTLSTQNRDIDHLPLLLNGNDAQDQELCDELVQIARDDETSSEASWQFLDMPLLRRGTWRVAGECGNWGGANLAEAHASWVMYRDAAVRRMAFLEAKNDEKWVTAYSLGDDAQPVVNDDEVTLSRPDVRADVAAFLSYAVGCMMGRYSLDKGGLILGDACDTLQEYFARVQRTHDQLTYAPDEDGVVPVLDGEWFEDDIVARTLEFLTVTFGSTTLRENLRFVEESLGADLRKYFLVDFYKDHLQTYKKRPIYWMVQSPQKGFRVLVYLHRYTRDTLNVVLNRYLREYQSKLRNRIAQMAQSLAGDDLSARERTAARKDMDRMTKVLAECEEWERSILLPLAQQRIELDLDDGVKVNYLRLSAVLAPIPGLAASDE